MDIEEAFRTLDLTLDANEDDVRRMYVTLTKRHHPDAGGDGNVQAALNAAQEHALAYLKIRTAVVPVSSAALAAKVEQAVAPLLGPSAVEGAQRAVRRKLSTLNRLKWLSIIIVARAGLINLIGSDAAHNLQLAPNVQRFIQLAVTPLAVPFGCLAAGLQIVISYVSWQMDRFIDSIAHRTGCARVLATALLNIDESEISEHDIAGPRHAVRRLALQFAAWVPILRRHILSRERDQFPVGLRAEELRAVEQFPWVFSAEELAPLLLKKSVEHGLIAPEEPKDITPDFVQKYRLKFKPSLFRVEHRDRR
jgi:hypothetical protein